LSVKERKMMLLEGYRKSKEKEREDERKREKVKLTNELRLVMGKLEKAEAVLILAVKKKGNTAIACSEIKACKNRLSELQKKIRVMSGLEQRVSVGKDSVGMVKSMKGAKESLKYYARESGTVGNIDSLTDSIESSYAGIEDVSSALYSTELSSEVVPLEEGFEEEDPLVTAIRQKIEEEDAMVLEAMMPSPYRAPQALPQQQGVSSGSGAVKNPGNTPPQGGGKKDIGGPSVKDTTAKDD
jgi:hypothetical protein